MTATQIPAVVKETPTVKTLMDLGHLSMPNASHPPKSWLTGQAEHREKAKQTIKDLAKAYFPETLPDYLFESFATRLIADLDNL